MLNFRQIEINDYEKVSQLFVKSGIENCEHCFATMLVWSKRHDVHIAVEENTVFMRSFGKRHIWYLLPRGEMDKKQAIEKIIRDADGKKISIYGIDELNAIFLNENFGDEFCVQEDRDGSDYLYKTEDLATLPGKNYQKKRNHCSRFERDNEGYSFHPITKENVEKAKDFEREWCARNNCDESRGLYSEQMGIMEILDNLENTDVFGGFIEIADGTVVAFTLAAPINDRMVDVIVEKAFHDVNGAYAIINRDFAKNCLQNFEFINREDDMGQENLRKAKLSYFPYEIRTKYLAKMDII